MEKGADDLMKQLMIRIKLQSQVIVSDSGMAGIMSGSRDYISGTIVRGMLAKSYIEAKGLGNAAHEDGDFQQLFYGDVNYLPATLWDAGTGSRATALPCCIQKSKTGKEMLDLIYDAPQPGFKTLKGYGIISGNKVKAVSPAKTITLHISRNPYNDAQGDTRLAGKSLEGNIYNYESLEMGQVFATAVIGPEEQLGRLKEVLGNKFTSHIGKSKYTQYGSCQVEIGNITPVENASFSQDGGDKVVLRLATAYIPCYGAGKSQPQQLAEEISCTTGQKWQLARCFANTEKIDNFVGVWHMRHPRETAISAGSVIELQKDGGISSEDYNRLQELCCQGLGRRTQEGFGQLRLWQQKKLQPFAEAAATNRKSRGSVANKQVQAKAMQIIISRLLDQVRNIAYYHGIKAQVPEEAAHALSRMSAILGPQPVGQNALSINLAEKFAQQLKAEFKDERYFYAIKINGTRLSECLEHATSSQPYTEELMAYIESSHLDEILGLLNQSPEQAKLLPLRNIVVHTYWFWLLRHMRKALK